MALQAGTTNLPSLNLQDNLTVGGTAGFVGSETHAGAETHTGNETHSGTITNTGPVTNQVGGFMPGTLYGAAGTFPYKSGYFAYNVGTAGFDVQLPAPLAGAEIRIVNQIAATSGTNTATVPSGGTIYQGTVSGTRLNFTVVGQTAMLLGISSTQYRSLQPGTMNPSVS